MGDLESMYADLENHHIEGFAHHGDTPFRTPLITHITDDLWMGGCRDQTRLPDDFRYVVSLYPWERYDLGPDTERIEVQMYDSDTLDSGQVVSVAHQVNQFRARGKTLVHCQAGLNRSSLIVATALILEGMGARDAINLLRSKRSPAVLCNHTFERWLLLGEEPSP